MSAWPDAPPSQGAYMKPLHSSSSSKASAEVSGIILASDPILKVWARSSISQAYHMPQAPWEMIYRPEPM